MTYPTLLMLLSAALACGLLTCQADMQPPALTTLALRVKNMEAMTAFYSEAFGVKFRPVDTGGPLSQVRDILRLMLRQALSLALPGIALGLLAAWALTRLLRDLLFQISANDPLTFLSVAALLAVVVLLACYVPARRATRVDPLRALRCD